MIKLFELRNDVVFIDSQDNKERKKRRNEMLMKCFCRNAHRIEYTFEDLCKTKLEINNVSFSFVISDKEAKPLDIARKFLPKGYKIIKAK